MAKGVDPRYKAMMIQAKKSAAKEATMQSTRLFIALPVFILHDKFGWGRLRCERFIDEMAKFMEAYSENRLNVADVLATIQEELGFDILQKDNFWEKM